MNTKKLMVVCLLDGFFFVILFLVSLCLISFYSHADVLNTGYADWMVHAFRIKFLQTYGLLSWTHSWDNGMNIWKSYQFIPHFLTLGLSNILHVSITRAMVLMIIGQFIFFRLCIYVVLRLLHFSSVTAFVCGLLSFDIAQYWGGVSDFSLLFGFTLFPIVLYLWVRYFQGKLSYFFPYSIGLLFYIHPLLGIITIALWATAVLFSERNIFSFSVGIQGLIILASSSLFWFPLVVKTSYAYSALFMQTQAFLTQVLAPYRYYGLSLFLLICFGVCFFHSFIPTSPKFRWTKILFVFTGAYFLLVILGLTVHLPAVIDKFQFTRGVTFIGICIIFTFAPVIEKVKQVRSVALQGVFLFLLGLACVEGVWFTSFYSPQPAKNFPEVTTAYIAKKESNITDARVWSSTIDTSSFYAPLSMRFPYSYMSHLDSNELSPRLASLILYQPYIDIVPLVSMDRLASYVKLSGTKYLFFDEASPLTKSFLHNTQVQYKDLGKINASDFVSHGFAVPWQLHDAVLIAPKYQNNVTHFPFSLELSDVTDQISMDSYVHTFTNTIYASENTAVPITYPAPDRIQIAIPRQRNSNVVYINESFDKDWKAYFHNRQMHLSSVGPNFMVVKLDRLQDFGMLVLKHDWPLSFYISCFLITLIPVEIVVLSGLRLLFQKGKKKNE